MFTGLLALLDAIGLGFLYRAIKDVIGAVLRRFRPMENHEKIALRQKWKPKFEDHIRENHVKKLRSDVIIRDVRRVDQYPDLEEGAKGISPWFRVGLVGTYHRGIYVAFQWNRLVEIEGGSYRVLDILEYDKDNAELEERSIKVIQLGSIPFENIEDVDFEGDEYYGYPHIYCHFSIKKQPYEKVAFYTQNQISPDSLPFYTELADVESVRKESVIIIILNLCRPQKSEQVKDYYYDAFCVGWFASFQL